MTIYDRVAAARGTPERALLRADYYVAAGSQAGHHWRIGSARVEILEGPYLVQPGVIGIRWRATRKGVDVTPGGMSPITLTNPPLRIRAGEDAAPGDVLEDLLTSVLRPLLTD